jgi:hypothetical protein
VVPVIGGDAQRQLLPRLDPKPPFVYAWHPQVWIIMAGKLIPGLSPRRLQPGVSNISANRQGVVSINAMRDHVEARGWRLLPYAAAPDGVSYLRKTKVDPSGDGRMTRVHYHGFAERLFPGTNRIQTDEAAYTGWLTGLIARGIIAPCPEIVARGMAEKVQERIGKLERDVSKGMLSSQSRLKLARGELATITAYIEQCEASNAEPVESERADEVPDVG